MLLLGTSCSNVDLVGLNSLYPRISGRFDLIASVNESPTSRYNGLLDITRRDFSDPVFGGTYVLTLTNIQTGQILGTSQGAIVAGLLGRDSTFQASLTDNNFRLSGQVKNGVITGTLVANSSFGLLTGGFTAIPRF